MIVLQESYSLRVRYYIVHYVMRRESKSDLPLANSTQQPTPFPSTACTALSSIPLQKLSVCVFDLRRVGHNKVRRMAIIELTLFARSSPWGTYLQSRIALSNHFLDSSRCDAL